MSNPEENITERFTFYSHYMTNTATVGKTPTISCQNLLSILYGERTPEHFAMLL